MFFFYFITKDIIFAHYMLYRVKVKLTFGILWKWFFQESLENIDINRYARITEEQVSVYKMPEGELYNKAVLKL